MATSPYYYDPTKGETITAEATNSLTTIYTTTAAGFIVGASVSINDTPTGGYGTDNFVVQFYINNQAIFNIAMSATEVAAGNTKYLTDSSVYDKYGNIAIPFKTSDAIKVIVYILDVNGDLTTTGADEFDVSVSVMYP